MEVYRKMMVQREVQIRPVSSEAAIPLVVGGILLGNMADMTYGNKRARVKERGSMPVTT
jgi:hypothetical protein